MQSFLQQFSVKDLLTYLFMGVLLWYNTQGAQKDKDFQQDQEITALKQSFQYLTKATEENTATMKEVRDELITQRERLKQLNK